ncbi:hypothetical protein SUGI_0592060 [Cryptomeria japonica]|nr:hypothetical protein SUGI_0592060 [Cryptomeria japonica]
MGMNSHIVDSKDSDKSGDDERQSCVLSNPIVRFLFGCVVGENGWNERSSNPQSAEEASSLIVAQEHFRQVQRVRL